MEAEQSELGDFGAKLRYSPTTSRAITVLRLP